MKKEKRISPLKRLIEWRFEWAWYFFVSCLAGYSFYDMQSEVTAGELPGHVLIISVVAGFLSTFAVIIIYGCFLCVAAFLWQKIRANSRAVLLVLASVSIAVVLVLAMMWR